jgi:hypothetical protein
VENDVRARKEIELFKIELQPLFIFGLFAGADEFAKLAKMMAVERFLQRLREAGIFCVIDRHSHPGDGLQKRPMSADAQDEREHDYPLLQSNQHDGDIRPSDLSDKLNDFAAVFEQSERVTAACFNKANRFAEQGAELCAREHSSFAAARENAPALEHQHVRKCRHDFFDVMGHQNQRG